MKFYNETLLARNSKVAVEQVYGLTYRDLKAGDKYTFYGFGATGQIILEVFRHPEYDSRTGDSDYVSIFVTYENLITGKRKQVEERDMVSMSNGDFQKTLLEIWKTFSEKELKNKPLF